MHAIERMTTGTAGRRSAMTHTIPDTDALYSDGRLIVRERNNPDAWLACDCPVPVSQ